MAHRKPKTGLWEIQKVDAYESNGQHLHDAKTVDRSP